MPSSVTTDEVQDYTFTATASDHDLRAQTLTFSLSGAGVPSGATIGAASGVFIWTLSPGSKHDGTRQPNRPNATCLDESGAMS